MGDDSRPNGASMPLNDEWRKMKGGLAKDEEACFLQVPIDALMEAL